MSKSLGNVIAPQNVTSKMGAEVLRLWVSMVNFLDDVRLSDEILERNAEAYRKIRNTFRYFLGNLHDFDPARDLVPAEKVLEIDRWALEQLSGLIARVRSGYEGLEFHLSHHALHNFCAVDMSSVYLDVIKDRLYVESADSHARRSAQTVLFHCAESLCLLIAPILPFTAEEVWKVLPGRGARAESVHLSLFPRPASAGADESFRSRWQKLFAIREKVTAALEMERQSKKIGQSLEAAVRIRAAGETLALLRSAAPDLAPLFIVSRVSIEEAPRDLEVIVERAPGARCSRCWHIREDLGADPDHPALCARCAPIVRRLGEPGAA